MSPPFLNAELLIFKPNPITGKLLSILSEIQAFKQDYEPCNLLIEIKKKKLGLIQMSTIYHNLNKKKISRQIFSTRPECGTRLLPESGSAHQDVAQCEWSLVTRTPRTIGASCCRQ